MIKAGALYYALFISFIVTLILGAVILCTFYGNRYLELQQQRYKADLNAGSGITLALYDTNTFKKGTSLEYDLYGQGKPVDSIRISKSDWGLYEIIQSVARWKDYTARRIALAGTDQETCEPVALYLADKNRYLSVCGRTLISGTCYLPKQGIRKAYIEGQNFTGGKLVNGEVKTSQQELPSLDYYFIGANIKYLQNNIPDDDSLVSPEALLQIDTVKRSFEQKPLVIVTGEPLRLENKVFRGNIRIVSMQSLYVANSTVIENSILYAPVIYFEKGFHGTVQAFARDSLIVGENCELSFPSGLGIMNKNMNNIYLEVKENCRIAGGIILYQVNKAGKPPYLKIGNRSVVHGQVYCPGLVELKGKVEGSLFCEGFTLRTSSSVYENHLLNATVDRSSLSEYYSGIFPVCGYKNARTIRWLK